MLLKYIDQFVSVDIPGFNTPLTPALTPPELHHHRHHHYVAVSRLILLDGIIIIIIRQHDRRGINQLCQFEILSPKQDSRPSGLDSATRIKR